MNCPCCKQLMTPVRAHFFCAYCSENKSTPILFVSSGWIKEHQDWVCPTHKEREEVRDHGRKTKVSKIASRDRKSS
jgi:hypothetical protein